MSHTKFIPSLLLTGALALGLVAAPAPARAQVNLGSGIVINDISLTDVAIDPVTGILTGAGGTVSGTVAGLPFTTGLTDFAIDLVPDDPATPAAECSVLHLALAPIDLDLLGLSVDTSAICLNITAIEGGGLLGDLLCSLAGGDGLTSLERLALLDDVLGGVGDLTGALTQILNSGLSQPGTQQALPDICDGECEVLDLAVGPVNLSLLGLVVDLDNCDDGPVQVCVSATAGAGLLGDLLCGLTDGGLLGNLNLGSLENLLGSVLGGLGTNTGTATPKETKQLVNQVGKLLRDDQLTDNELAKVKKTVNKITRR
jgi:hypothetical protein